jgi:hypothetical protein
LTEYISQANRSFGAACNPLARLALTKIDNTLANLENKADAVRRALFEARSRQKDEEKIERQREEAAEKNPAAQRLRIFSKRW